MALNREQVVRYAVSVMRRSRDWQEVQSALGDTKEGS